MKSEMRIRILGAAVAMAALGGTPPGVTLWGGLAAAHAQAGANERGQPGPGVARGKRLILKDGSFQIVRSYEKKGDRVRYYSLERSAWEELPVELVDWDATAKYEAERSREEEALAKKVRVEEEATRIDVAMDIDASLPVAPGVFLPPGEGLFVVEGKGVTQLDQVATESHTDKKQVLKQVLVPIPLPSKRNLNIPGAKARVRVAAGQPEFYLREALPDPERTSAIRKSGRAGESGPAVELIRAKAGGGKRRVESVSNYFGQEMGTRRDSIAFQRWEVAPNVFKFTLGEPLKPGEYVIAEFLQDGMNLFVWDFGVDAEPGKNPAAPARKQPK